ncbi:MAG: hypothetical protein WBF42_08195, partial [Terracidiphilus sp.]
MDKLGQVACLAGRFSISPELHSRVLENSPRANFLFAMPHRQAFHFSNANYGYYCLLSLLKDSYPVNRRTDRMLDRRPPIALPHAGEVPSRSIVIRRGTQ